MADPEWMKIAKQHPGAELDFQVRVRMRFDENILTTQGAHYRGS